MFFSDGLPINLRYPVPPKPKPPLPLFSTMPRHPPKMKTQKPQPVLPTDESMNTVGLFEEGSKSEELASGEHTLKKKSVFNTLISKRSPKKTSIIDSMSLRKYKKPKPPPVMSADETYLKMENLKKAKEVLKNLSFSTDFKDLHLNDDERMPLENQHQDTFYNVPRNNSSVLLESKESITNNVPMMELERKTEAEVEYFTMTDVAIERERMEMNNMSCELTDAGSE